MEGQHFDDLAKALGRSNSRRSFMKALGAGVAGALFAGFGTTRAVERAEAQTGTTPTATNCAPGTPWHQCAQRCPDWCHANFPGDAGRYCAANGLNGIGPCWTCGPAAPPSHPDVCQGVCCPASTPACCGSSCTNLQTDVNNCGVCGNACPNGQTCQSGKCAQTCLANGTPTTCPSGAGSAAPQCCSGKCNNVVDVTPQCCSLSGQPCNLDNPGECCSLTCINGTPTPHCA